MKYCFIFATVAQTATAILANVELLPDDTPVQDIKPKGKKNIAFFRSGPCRPVPLCSAAIDDNIGTTVGLESSNRNWPLARIDDAASAFHIFFQKYMAISDVIVVCSPSQYQDLSGTLLVTIWSNGDGQFDLNNGSGFSNGWSKQIARNITIKQLQGTRSEIIKVAFRIEEFKDLLLEETKLREDAGTWESLPIQKSMKDAASAITIEWRSLSQEEAINDTLPISEVMVLTNGSSEYDVAVIDGDMLPVMDGADIMRMKNSAWAKLSHQNDSETSTKMPGTNVSNARSSHEAVAANRDIEAPQSGLVVNGSSRSKKAHGPMFYNKHRHRTTMPRKYIADTTLAPGGRVGMSSVIAEVPDFLVRGSADSSKFQQVQDAEAHGATTASVGLQFQIVALAGAILVGACLLFNARVIDFFLCCKRTPQLAALDDPEAGFEHRRELAREGTDVQLGCARRFRLHTPPPTESEPEEESEPLIPAIPNAPEQEVLEPRPSLLSLAAPSVQNLNSRRLVHLYASPLCGISGNRPVPLQQINVEKERNGIRCAYDEAKAALRMSDSDTVKRQPSAIFEEQLLTADSLRKLIAPSPDPTRGCSAAVLHVSAHGMQDQLVVENGKATAHCISRDVLQGMFGSGNPAPAKLVVLAACSLRALGDQFVQSGVPHVICYSAGLRDTASHVFLCAMYSSLFQGGTVAHAFNAAIVALRSDPEESTKAAADYFHLLPEQAPHNEVIFRLDIVASPPKLTHAVSSELGAIPMSTTLNRDSSGTSGSSTGSSFLTTDVTESSTDGPDESCCSEGHVDTSSASGSRGSSRIDTSSDSEDGSANATENTSLLLSNEATDGTLLPLTVSRRPRTTHATYSRPARNLVNPTPMPKQRPGKNTCKRRLPQRRSVPSRGTAQVQALPSPFERPVPTLPENFLGRVVETWEILQSLASDRRALVVCGAPGTSHGIGKTALLDAVHRAYSFQMGGICIPVHLRCCKSDVASVASTWEWMEKVRAQVQSTFDDYQEFGRQAIVMDQKPVLATFAHKSSIVSGVCTDSAQALRRRISKGNPKAVTRGFHSLSDPIATKPVLEELVSVMSTFAEYCEERNRGMLPSASGVRILLLLDECDHLIQQKHFQDAIAKILRTCSAYKVLFSTQQPLVETGGGLSWFKVVHVQLKGLPPESAAELFLHRVHRPLYWDEFPAVPGDNAIEDSAATAASEDATTRRVRQPVLTTINKAEVLSRVAAHPVVAAQQGNPRRLVEIASQVRDSLENLSDLAYR